MVEHWRAYGSVFVFCRAFSSSRNVGRRDFRSLSFHFAGCHNPVTGGKFVFCQILPQETSEVMCMGLSSWLPAGIASMLPAHGFQVLDSVILTLLQA